MTATRNATIWCDGKIGNNPHGRCERFEFGDTALAIRTMLRDRGWRVGVSSRSGGDIADYCPEHSSTESQTGEDR